MQNAIIKYESGKKHWSKEESEDYLRQYKNSHGSMADFCRANKIPTTIFYGWIRRAKKGRLQLAEVKMDTVPRQYQSILLKFPNQIELSMKIESASEFKGVLRSILTC